jgi:hypothetical protein
VDVVTWVDRVGDLHTHQLLKPRPH